MMARGVFPKRSTDKLGQDRFMPEAPGLQAYIQKQKADAGIVPITNKPCTTYCISMHHIPPLHMRYLYDQLYHCRR
jgi:hypothetical protein